MQAFSVPEAFEIARTGERSTFVVGCDVAQSVDRTALTVIEKRSVWSFFDDGRREVRETRYDLRHAERLPLRMSYPSQAGYIRGIMERPELEGAELVLDTTGVGQACAEIFELAGLEPIKVVITSGERADFGNGNWRVPKLELISNLQARLHNGELRIAAGLPEARALASELQDFRLAFTAAGNTTFGAKAGKHDDLVLSLSLALWWARRGPQCISMDWDDG